MSSYASVVSNTNTSARSPNPSTVSSQPSPIRPVAPMTVHRLVQFDPSEPPPTEESFNPRTRPAVHPSTFLIPIADDGNRTFSKIKELLDANDNDDLVRRATKNSVLLSQLAEMVILLRNLRETQRKTLNFRLNLLTQELARTNFLDLVEEQRRKEGPSLWTSDQNLSPDHRHLDLRLAVLVTDQWDQEDLEEMEEEEERVEALRRRHPPLIPLVRPSEPSSNASDAIRGDTSPLTASDTDVSIAEEQPPDITQPDVLLDVMKELAEEALSLITQMTITTRLLKETLPENQ
ncbi:hypothetical protein V5O48_015025 [Marasmius crinis-equi]|uniref:Uncharacterized protein n=1 Tax=Marasmius crinis-equi TaxID=585013 RepID=A0ABR3EVP9_9AGAR